VDDGTLGTRVAAAVKAVGRSARSDVAGLAVQQYTIRKFEGKQ
jgi:hypothetical protein